MMPAGRAVIAGMRSIAPDQGVHRIKPCVPKEAHEHLELSGQAVLGRERSASPLPQTSPPECRIAMNVLVAAGQKANARPALQMLQSRGQPAETEVKGAPRDPLDVRKRRENASNRVQPICVKHFPRLEPTQDFSRRFRKGHVERGAKLRSWRAGLPLKMCTIPLQNFLALVVRAVLNEDVFKIGIALINDGPNCRRALDFSSKSTDTSTPQPQVQSLDAMNPTKDRINLEDSMLVATGSPRTRLSSAPSPCWPMKISPLLPRRLECGLQRIPRRQARA